jgi:anaerobic selenocysteine-containing dehydrogenase
MANRSNGSDNIFYHGACPVDCPDTCSWVVETVNGEAVSLKGNSDHPYTRGTLCNKLNDYLLYTRDPDRLLYPLKRTGKKGAGEFRRIDWDEALGEIADRWHAILNTHGGEAIWPFFGTGTLGMIQGLGGAGRRLWNRLGAVQHVVSICMISGCVATGYTLGHNQIGMEPEQLANSKLILLWGTNTLTSGHHLWRSIIEARKKGAYLVVIDPIRTRTADKADEHLAPIPGTDAALALGLLHTVVKLGAEDRAFIGQHTLGWAEFRARIDEYSPERVAKITGLPAEQIVALGTRLANTRPTGIKLGMGMQRHGGGGMAVRTISCIPGVTGDWRYPGGGAAFDTRGFFPGNWKAYWRDDLRERPARSLAMTRLGEGLLDLDEPPIKSLLMYGANPVASNPDQRRVREALSREDLFMIAIEHRHTDTTAYADIVLPSTMQTEHADLHYAYGHTYVAWNEPAVSPPGECLPHTEIFRRLARQLGLRDNCLYESDEEIAETILDSEGLRAQGVTLESLKQNGWAKLRVSDAPFANGFPTPSGRLEFFSAAMEAAGLDPVAGYTPPHETADADDEISARYPLCLIAPAAHYFLNSTFADMDLPRRRQGELPILLHPDDAQARQLADGDNARIFNDRGQFTARVKVTDAMRPGVAGSLKGYWPGLDGNKVNVNTTVAERDSDMGRGAVYHDNRVEIEAA